MKICYVTSDMDAPGSYRCLFPGRQLSKRGHSVAMPPRKEFDRDDGSTLVEFSVNTNPPTPPADIYVLQQRKERFWATDGVNQLRHHGVVTVAECDDNYLELPTWNPAFAGTHPYRTSGGEMLFERTEDGSMHSTHAEGRVRNRAERRAIEKKLRMKGASTQPNSANRVWMHRSFEQVDALTVSTPYLKKLYAHLNPNITVIRNYLDWEMWDDVELQHEVLRPRKRIGYMGVYRYRTGDLETLKPVVAPFLADHPEVDFVASSPETHDFLDVPAGQRITTGEVGFRSMKLPEITAVMDIGLVPLAMNGLNEAKSHLKGMEYNACGIPFIASPTESYKDYWCDGSNGLVASSTDEWRGHLEALVADDDRRRGMGAAGRAKAQANTIQEHVGEWESFYLSLLGGEEETLARTAVRNGAIQKVQELTGLVRLLQERRLKTVVEIGTALGGTFWLWCQLAAPDALIVSIDLPGGDFGGTEGLDEGVDKYGARNIGKMRGYARENQRLHFIQANSQLDDTRRQLEQLLEGRSIDFLMIDGDHAYKGVKRDFELYSPLVDGVVAFHDVLQHPRSPLTQVDKFWKQVKTRYRHAEFVAPRETWGWGQWGGIGALFLER